MIEMIIAKVCQGLRVDRITALIILIGVVTTVVFGLLAWIFSAVALSAMAKRRFVKGRWLGWFPLLNLILLGRIHDRYMEEVKNIPGDRRQSLPVLVVALTLSAGAAGFLWLVYHQMLAVSAWMPIAALVAAVCAVVVAVVFLVQLYSTCYNVYYSCVPDHAKLLTVITGILPVTMPFLLFGVRKKTNGMPPSRIQYK